MANFPKRVLHGTFNDGEIKSKSVDNTSTKRVLYGTITEEANKKEQFQNDLNKRLEERSLIGKDGNVDILNFRNRPQIFAKRGAHDLPKIPSKEEAHAIAGYLQNQIESTIPRSEAAASRENNSIYNKAYEDTRADLLNNDGENVNGKSDINSDGRVDIRDLVASEDVKIVDNKLNATDMNGDGKVDIRDIVAADEIKTATEKINKAAENLEREKRKETQLKKEYEEAKKAWEDWEEDDYSVLAKGLDYIGNPYVVNLRQDYEEKEKAYIKQKSIVTELNIQNQYGMTGDEYIAQLKEKKKNATTDKEKEYYKNLLDSTRINLYGEVNALEYIGKIAKEGLLQANKGVAATVDFLLGNPAKWLGFENNVFTETNNYSTYLLEKAHEETVEISKALGDDSNTYGEIGAATVAAIPDLIIAICTGGSSALTKGAQLGSKAITNANLLTKLTDDLIKTVKSPIFYTSFIRTLGVNYEENLATGKASEFEASMAAILASLITSRMEMGGFQELPEELAGTKGLWKKIYKYALSSAEEGLEEPGQTSVTNLINKFVFDYDKPIFSTTDTNAVFNPKRASREFLIGASVGAILGGGQLTFSGIVNASSEAQYKTIGQYAIKSTNIQQIIDYAKSARNEDIRTIAREVDAKSITDADAGRLYQYVVNNVNERFEDVYTVDDFNEIVSEYFSDNVPQAVRNIANAAFANKLVEMNIEPESNELYNSVQNNSQNQQLQIDGEGDAVVDSNANNSADTLQENSNGVIINNNQSVTGDGISVDGRTNEASVGEIREKYFKKTKDNDKRDVSETSEAFAERTRKIGTQSGRKKRILLKSGKSSIAYTPSNLDTPLNKFVKKLNTIGIEAYCSEEVVETNFDGITTIHDEAMTTSKGKIFFCESSKLANKEKADHELAHHAFRMLDDSYLDFEEIIMKNLNFESNYYIALCMELNEREYNNQYNVTEDGVSLEDAGAFNSEVAAYVYQMVLNKPDFANEFFSNMFTDWDAIVKAVDVFNSKMPIDTNELTQADPDGPANFMPEDENRDIGFTEPATKDIYREPTVEEENEAIFGKRKDAKQRHIIDVAKKLDSSMTVVFVDPDNEKLSGRAGVFMHDTNTMFLSNDNSVVGMYCQLFKHEFVHRLENKKAYQSFKNYLFKHSSAFENYARAKLKEINGTEFDGTREEALKAFSDYYIGLVQKGDFTAEYKRNFTAEYAEREMAADFIGEVLFKGKENRKDVAQSLSDSNMASILNMEDTLAEFENLNETDRNWFQRIIDTIKDWIASLKGIKQNERLVNDLEYIEQRLSRVHDSKDIKKAASRAVDRQYSLNENAESELHKALYDISYRNEVLLRDETPSIMLSQKGVKNLPMVMNASHIRENVFTEEEAAKLGLKVDGDKHYHGLGEKFFLKIIDGLDNVKEAYRGTKYANIPSRRENYFLLVSEFKDQDGNIINVPVYIEEGAQCNRVYLKSNKIATVFGKDDFRDYISNQLKNKNLVRIKNKNNKISEGGVPLTPAYENIALTDIILKEEDSVKNNISEEDKNYSDVGDIKQSFSLSTPAQQQRENLEKYENGEITKEEYLERTDELWGKANEKYGILPEGENAAAPIATPRAVAEDKPTERFTRTIIETGKLTDEMLEGIEEKVLLGDFAYEVISDEAATKKADTAIKNGTAEDIWNDTVNDGKRINKNQIAIGEKLLTEAIKNKDTKRVLELSSELADILTRAGQVVQAARLLKKMTGAGRLITAQRVVKTLNKDLRQKYGEDHAPIKISEGAAKRLANAKTEKGIEHAYEEVMQEVAEQMPVTFMDKWNAWRYFAMLSNPKTHIRNVVGNGIFTPAVRIKDAIAVGIEAATVKDKNKKTKSLIIKKEYRDFAKKDSARNDVKQLLKGNKYNDKTAIREKQKIFKTEALNFLTEFNSNALEAEDMLFKNKHYIHALAGFLQARGVGLNNVSNDVLDEARIYAVKEARKATFNDESALANAVQRFGNKNLAANLLVEGVLPFKRTPINIVKRGIEYSPIGLGKTLTKGVFDLKKGKNTVTEFIDGLASGLTGTGIMLVGMFLANLGCISGGEDDDEKSQFEKLLGKQEYAVEILGSSYTIDWAAPACIPFFIGVEIVNTINQGEAFEISQIGNAVWNSLEPITNLSMLSGIQGVIESARYADSAQTLSAIAVDSLTSYAMQGIPSLSGAISRTIDPTQRSWYIDKNDKWLDSTAQTVKNNIQSKIPGLSYTQIPKIDMWGREVSRGGVSERVLENFISPGYYSEIEYNEASEELKRIFNETDIDVFPNIAAKSFELNGETKYLTADEYVTYAKAKGEYSFDYITEFMENSAYKRLTDEEKADVIEGLYKYANAKAKTTVSEYDLMKSFKTVTNWEQNGRSAVDYYIYQAIKK